MYKIEYIHSTASQVYITQQSWVVCVLVLTCCLLGVSKTHSKSPFLQLRCYSLLYLSNSASFFGRSLCDIISSLQNLRRSFYGRKSHKPDPLSIHLCVTRQINTRVGVQYYFCTFSQKKNVLICTIVVARYNYYANSKPLSTNTKTKSLTESNLFCD